MYSLSLKYFQTRKSMGVVNRLWEFHLNMEPVSWDLVYILSMSSSHAEEDIRWFSIEYIKFSRNKHNGVSSICYGAYVLLRQSIIVIVMKKNLNKAHTYSRRHYIGWNNDDNAKNTIESIILIVLRL